MESAFVSLAHNCEKQNVFKTAAVVTIRRRMRDEGLFMVCSVVIFCINRDLPFTSIIVTPACNIVNNTRIRASISRHLVTNMANTLDSPVKNS